jgi:hypothetical protein
MSTAPNKILIWAVDPVDQARLRLDREIREIKDSWQRSKQRDQYVLDPYPATRPSDLQKTLLDAHPAVVHFSGHGSGPAGLVLEDDRGLARLVPTDALGGLFRLFEGDVQCVVLNSCLSAVQAEEIVRHVPYVIGMSQTVGDDAAINFSRGFYDALFAGEPYERAFAFGCNAIQLESLPEGVRKDLPGRDLLPTDGGAAGALPEHLKPVLLIRADVFVRSQPGDDAQVKGELLGPLTRAGLRVAGDWLFRAAGMGPSGRDATLRLSRHVLVVWTPAWRAADAGDPRVRLLLWDGPPPDKFTGPAMYDFLQPARRGEALTRLLTDLGVRAEAISQVLTQSARSGLDALGELLKTEGVRQAVGLVLATLTRARDDIGELNRWKQLHDRLHGLSDIFPGLSDRSENLKKAVTQPDEDQTPEERQRAVDGCWLKVRESVNRQILPSLRVLVAYAGPPTFRPDEIPWAATLQAAQGKIEGGTRDKDLKVLRRGVELLNPVVGQWMPSVDRDLFVIAKRVPLETLVHDLEDIGRTLDGLQLAEPAAARVAEYKRGIGALHQLHDRLQALVATHNYLQTIDSQTNHLVDPEVAAEDIDTAWESLAPAPALNGDGGAWLGDLSRQRAEVGQALPPALKGDARSLSRLRESFSDFRSQLDTGFLLADQRLKKFCEDLQAIRESLSQTIQGMRQ